MDTAVLVSVIVVAALVVLLALYLWASYGALVALRARVDEAWRDLTQQLQRRADLVPGLVETVRGYAAHDLGVLDVVDSARRETVAAKDPEQATIAETHLQQALRSTFSLADSYPQLQASTEFLQLQSELADSEEGIQTSRRFYNGGVREFNTKIQVFPNRMFAKRMGAGQRQFFEVSGTSTAQPPRVQF